MGVGAWTDVLFALWFGCVGLFWGVICCVWFVVFGTFRFAVIGGFGCGFDLGYLLLIVFCAYEFVVFCRLWV